MLDLHNDKIRPVYVEREIGESVSFECPSSSFLLTLFPPKWIHNKKGLDVTYPYTHSGTKLEIPSVYWKHAGIYSCHVSNFLYNYLAQAELKVFGEYKVPHTENSFIHA